MREYRLANLEKHKIWDRAKKLKRFGLTIEQYDKMLKKQNGVCALCGKPPTRTRLAVDHDHQTKIVRGLLCGLCNRTLGIIETRFGLARVAAYLGVAPVDSQTLADGATLKWVAKDGNFQFK